MVRLGHLETWKVAAIDKDGLISDVQVEAHLPAKRVAMDCVIYGRVDLLLSETKGNWLSAT